MAHELLLVAGWGGGGGGWNREKLRDTPICFHYFYNTPETHTRTRYLKTLI